MPRRCPDRRLRLHQRGGARVAVAHRLPLASTPLPQGFSVPISWVQQEGPSAALRHRPSRAADGGSGLVPRGLREDSVGKYESSPTMSVIPRLVATLAAASVVAIAALAPSSATAAPPALSRRGTRNRRRSEQRRRSGRRPQGGDAGHRRGRGKRRERADRRRGRGDTPRGRIRPPRPASRTSPHGPGGWAASPRPRSR